MKRALSVLLPAALVLAGATSILTARKASAEDAAADVAERNERCGIRVFTAMVGESVTPEVISGTAPQASFDTLVKDKRFVERFSSYVNSKMNRTPGATPAEDATYYVTKYVLENEKPWADMFIGQYKVAPSDPMKDDSPAVVTADPAGLGYFRSDAWAKRYAGNEGEGIRIVTAYRIMQNTIGLTLEATTNAPEADISKTGREVGVCKGCHYANFYALDKVAGVLGRTKRDKDGKITFEPPPAAKQTILSDRLVANDAELVRELVKSEGFSVNACRLAYGYLYGRSEYSCDGPVFDACVTAFKADGRIQSALAAVARNAGFCE